MIKILMVDDDSRLRELVSEYLAEYGFQVIHHEDCTGVPEKIQACSPSLVILDVMLPSGNGMDVIHQIREKSGIPVIMLTAKGSETDRIVGLELGADDYISKPFNSRELLARIKAVLRRSRSGPGSETSDRKTEIVCDDLILNPDTMSISCGQKSIVLSKTEYSIMEYLMENPNIALSRDRIMNNARGRDFIAFDRSIDVQISRLRSHLESVSGRKNMIKTVWGTGYMFCSRNI